MGFVTDIIHCNLEFPSRELLDEFEQLDPEIFQFSPISPDSFDLQVSDDIHGESREVYPNDYEGKFTYEVKHWAPELAKYVEGSIEFRTEDGEYYKMVFDEGQVKVYDGEITYQKEPRELWE